MQRIVLILFFSSFGNSRVTLRNRGCSGSSELQTVDEGCSYLLINMRREEENVIASWHSTIANFTSQSARWCLTWMPCSNLRNRIHPTVVDESNSNFISLDSRKRLHIIHLCPDSTHPSVLVGFNRTCCKDVPDGGSPESISLEEYWFTKSSRPLRLQKNPCRCSFRRSMRIPAKSKRETKDSVDNVEPVLQRKAKSHILTQPENVHSHRRIQLTPQIVERIADSLSLEIINQVFDECLSSKKSTHCFDVISTSVEHLASDNHCPCNDILCSKEIDFSFSDFEKRGHSNLSCDAMTGRQATGGYMNPTFIGSSGTIDKLTDGNDDAPVVDKHFESSANMFDSKCESSHNHSTRNNPTIKGVGQDYNANEKDIIVKKNKLNDSEKSQEDYVERRHHKDCSHSSKPCQKKPLLFFLHGVGDSAQVWSTLMTSMVAAGYECVAPDLLGHGSSSAPHRASYYTFHNLLKDLLKMFDKFVVKGRSAVILGHGYGCSFATAISRFRAEQVVQLVLISGGGPSPLAPPESNPPSPFMLTCLDPLLLCGFKRDVMFSMYGKQPIGCTAEDCAVPPIILHNLAKGHIWPEGDAAFHRRITAPTLLVHGLRDPHVTLVQQCEMERTVPRSFLEVLPEAGHWPMLEAPESLSHMVLCFIDWWAQ